MVLMNGLRRESDGIEARKARGTLERMLGQAGVSLDSADTRALWEVFKQFVQRPATDVDADADGDLVLFEAGKRASERFEIALVRQFSFTDEEQEYLGMEQVQLRRTFSAPAGTVPAPVSIWGVARIGNDAGDTGREGIHPNLTRWFGAVEADSAFLAALSASPRGTTLRQGPL
jgi:hypothetical protein